MVDEKELSIKDLGDLRGVYGIKAYPYTRWCAGRVTLYIRLLDPGFHCKGQQ